ncbi:MAG: hypothetical protein KF760_34685 [Candidatus Eremiobacteraeota bacterium]|nr:hypothetical protein [Candidatus Eremiobacteraeota bacterium]MCW5868412.1 hypothetical protein [Candidatus Eremiobacteraeota bacterium]
MRKVYLTQAALALALSLPVAAQEADITRALRQFQQPAKRAQALKTFSEQMYSLENPKLRGQVCAALTQRLKSSKKPAERRELASLLESYLSHAQTPSSHFANAEPLLLDPDERVRHPIWLAFYQQASQPHLTPAQDDRLLALVRHQDPKIRLEALNWANEATQNRQLQVGAPASPLGRKVLALQLKLSDDPDPSLRNMAIYGCFQQLEHAPDQVTEVARKHLNDAYAATRSLVLDFLQQAARRDDKLCQLQPDVLQRFRQPIDSQDFPLVPDAELGPDASPPLDERYRLVQVAAAMGPLPEDAWKYLEEVATKQVPPELLLNLARSQSRAARPLLEKILNAQNFALAADVLAECGLPDSLVAPVVLELQKRHKEVDTEQANQTASLILSLADRPQAAAAEAFLTSTHPQIVAAAAYMVARHQAGTPVARQAAQALSQVDWKIAFQGGTTMLAAVDRLRADHPFELEKLKGTTVDVDLLLGWLLAQEDSDKTPQFVDEYARGAALSGRIDPGVTGDFLILEMKWIAAHKSQLCEPGLRRLLYHPDERVRQEARLTLTAIGKN